MPLSAPARCQGSGSASARADDERKSRCHRMSIMGGFLAPQTAHRADADHGAQCIRRHRWNMRRLGEYLWSEVADDTAEEKNGSSGFRVGWEPGIWKKKRHETMCSFAQRPRHDPQRPRPVPASEPGPVPVPCSWTRPSPRKRHSVQVRCRGIQSPFLAWMAFFQLDTASTNAGRILCVTGRVQDHGTGTRPGPEGGTGFDNPPENRKTPKQDVEQPPRSAGRLGPRFGQRTMSALASLARG